MILYIPEMVNRYGPVIGCLREAAEITFGHDEQL